MMPLLFAVVLLSSNDEIWYSVHKERRMWMQATVENIINKPTYRHQEIYSSADDSVFGYELLLAYDNGKAISDILNIRNYFIRHSHRLTREQAFAVSNSKLGTEQIVFMNFTPGQLSSTHFLESFDAMLNYGLVPEKVFIELTEMDDVYNNIKLKDNLRKLRERGHKIVVDDFGVGASTINTVLKLKPEIVKLDKSIIALIDEISGGPIYLKTLIDFLHSLSSLCVVEGIETQRQLNIAKQAGCDFYQGYYASMPKELTLETSKC